MFFDMILIQLSEEVQSLLGLFDDVVDVDVPFQSITDVGAKESEGVCQDYGLNS